ncbi:MULTISPECIES: hypothetical protein [Streptomyces]|uniref:Uncharacterized protein n=1 Tax=Streptomyces katrae TaxID=68223 RepID=A0ABT7H5J7_9ACTN|nr:MULTISPECIES: hypothetical protein [Streptomyces]MDK9500746.1 hypothetical protein [Streptomyces katrae]GLX19408.1 hypothetical protein Slala01_30520 [Streptomyces lavendulae subsp. lavendulae]GLX31054.1 hypothetical protein Slala02_68740 [Streptomyces lavendulae subsp. lavendulae]
MHSHDPSRAPFRASSASHTPIYDSLYSEYLRAFRALPGDRTGEEDLGFTAFSYGTGYGGSAYGGSSYGGGTGTGWNGSSWQQADGWQPSYLPQQQVPQPAYSYAGGGAGYGGGRQHHTGMQHIPAALPPAPRRGY